MNLEKLTALNDELDLKILDLAWKLTVIKDQDPVYTREELDKVIENYAALARNIAEQRIALNKAPIS